MDGAGGGGPGGRRRAWLIAGAFAAIYILWGSTYLAIRYAIETLPPLGMAGSRFVVAGAVMYAFARWRGHARPTARQWLVAAVAGVLLLAGGNGMVVLGQRHVPSGVTSLIIATQAVWISVLALVVPGARRSGLRGWIGIGLGLAGLATLVGFDGGVSVVGCSMLLTASLSWATGTMVGQVSQRRGLAVPSLVLGAGMQMLAGGGVLLAASVARGEWADGVANASAASLLGWAYLVVFGSIVAFTAYVWLLGQVSAPAVATYSFVNPVVAVLLGWGLAGEALSGRTLIAAAVIVGGVALIVLDGVRDRRARGTARGTGSAPPGGEGAPAAPPVITVPARRGAEPAGRGVE